MSYVLHWAITGDISWIKRAVWTPHRMGFDLLDIKLHRFIGTRTLERAPFLFAVPEPVGDLWLGFRYRDAQHDAITSAHSPRVFWSFMMGRMMLGPGQTSSVTSRITAIAHGDAASRCLQLHLTPAPAAMRIDLRVLSGRDHHRFLRPMGFCNSTPPAPNSAAKGKARTIGLCKQRPCTAISAPGLVLRP